MRKIAYAMIGAMMLAGGAVQVAVAADSNSADAHSSHAKEGDNTGINKRDREDATLTPMDQSNKESDIKTTQQIRKAVVEDDSLSVNAQNVKIITVDGEVTLRGPVESEEERQKIVEAAESVAGDGKVKDQLDLAGR